MRARATGPILVVSVAFALTCAPPSVGASGPAARKPAPSSKRLPAFRHPANPFAPDQGSLIRVPRALATRGRTPRTSSFAATVRYGSATGFMVYREPIRGTGEDRALILTNDHVAGGKRFVAGRMILMADGTVARAVRLISSSGASDHALVEVRLPRRSSATPARLDLAGLRPEQRIASIGSALDGFDLALGRVAPLETGGLTLRPPVPGADPGEALLTMASGDLSGPSSTWVFKAKAPNRGGMSGAPVTDATSRRVVGIQNGGLGATMTAVSIKRVVGDLRTAPMPRGARALVDRMLAWQASDRPAIGARGPARAARRPARPVRLRPGTGATAAERRAIDDLGFLFFGDDAFTGGDRSNLTLSTDDGELVGFVTYERRGDTLHVPFLATHPEHQGAGVMDRLLDRLEAHAAATPGVRAIALDVAVDNRGARGFYAKRGFVDVGGDASSRALERALPAAAR